MADIFVSYSREDAARAALIVDGLRAEGLDVWWDQGLGTGSIWREQIDKNLSSARLVVVLWSNASVRSKFVRDEAGVAEERGVLCPVLIDALRPPLGFGEVQTTDLVGWMGARGDPAWRHFATSLRAKLDGHAPPERRAPRPRHPLWPFVFRMVAAVAAVLSIVATLDQFGVINIIPDSNRPPLTYSPPAPTGAERATWEQALASNNCDDIRAYVRKHPNGAYTLQAQALLNARVNLAEQYWAPFQQASVVTGSSNTMQRKSEADACASAQASMQRNAETGCQIYSSEPVRYRNIETQVSPGACDCRNNAIEIDGMASPAPMWTCTVRSMYSCRGQVVEQRLRESCGD